MRRTLAALLGAALVTGGGLEAQGLAASGGQAHLWSSWKAMMEANGVSISSVYLSTHGGGSLPLYAPGGTGGGFGAYTSQGSADPYGVLTMALQRNPALGAALLQAIMAARGGQTGIATFGGGGTGFTVPGFLWGNSVGTLHFQFSGPAGNGSHYPPPPPPPPPTAASPRRRTRRHEWPAHHRHTAGHRHPRAGDDGPRRQWRRGDRRRSGQAAAPRSVTAERQAVGASRASV